ncbi:hypothetical protein [uncultured Erythrobacter sp.]|uniref:hypothetical protein n=1 Tax=uncultured Erythrobacter sp. TaxID=263913 RepID=UPI002638BC18|nr:hypothetical protein [uncultured Erythrobacter sp.]
MEMLKAMGASALLTACVALVIGSQGTTGGALAIYAISHEGFRFFWSWPLFFCGSGLGWGLMLLQR